MVNLPGKGFIFPKKRAGLQNAILIVLIDGGFTV
jgi:hypothetical protein